MFIAIEWIEQIDELRRKINKADLSDIVFFKEGKRVDIPVERIEEFEFTGLSNFDFITSGFYLTGFEKMETKEE